MIARSGLQGLLMHSAVYWVGVMVSKLIGFMLIPVYTHHLSPADYGTLELIALATDVTALVLGMRIGSAVFRFYHAATTAQDKRRVVTTAVHAMVALAIVCFIILYSASGLFSQLLFSGDQMTTAFRVMFLATFTGLAMELGLVYIRIRERSMLFVFIVWTQLFIMLTLNIYFIVYLRMGVLGALLGPAIANAVLCPPLLVWVLHQVRDRFDPARLWQMVAYSAPLVPASIGLFILHFGDRFFLNHYASLEDVGVYAIAYKFGFLISQLVAYPFGLIWGNRLYVYYRDPNRDRLFNQTLSGFCFFLVGSALAISLFIPEVLSIMTPPEYWAAGALVPAIAMAYVFGGMNQLAAAPLYTESRTGIVAVISLSAAAVNLLLNFILIPTYGVWGAAAATAASFLLILGCSLAASRHISSLRWQYGRALKPMAAALILLAAGHAIDWANPWVAVGYKALLLISYVPLLLLLKFISAEEWHTLRSLVPVRRHEPG
ncbi:MAG: polysaccharide biosynthesis C-terminal domain-containing protein [Aquisalimonadaceae bacterium]